MAARFAGFGVTTVVAVTVMAGCSNGGGQPTPQTNTFTSATAAPSSSSSRPRSIALTGIDPCSLLTPAQKAQFGIDPSRVNTDPAEAFNNAPRCFWSTDQDAYAFELITSEGIGAWTNGTRQGKVAQQAPIDGFPAISITPPTPQACYTAVDVADGQYLLATIDTDVADTPKMCELARQLAQAGMSTLESRK